MTFKAQPTRRCKVVIPTGRVDSLPLENILNYTTLSVKDLTLFLHWLAAYPAGILYLMQEVGVPVRVAMDSSRGGTWRKHKSSSKTLIIGVSELSSPDATYL